MPSIAAAWQQVRQRLAIFPQRGGDAAVSSPLLGPADILDLRLRILAQRARRQAAFDTTHPRLGDERSVYRGLGLDYEESRPYQAGDEPRYINWQLTARTGELYSKVFREERRPGVFVVVDRRAAMRFGTRTRLKVTQAARVATCIAFAAQQGHHALAGVMLQPGPCWLTQRSGEQAALALAHAAGAPCPPLATEETSNRGRESAAPDLASVLKQLQVMLTPGSILYLISDFMDLSAAQRPLLAQLAARHAVHAIHIVDPAEQALPPVGKVRLQSSDGRYLQLLDSDTDSIRQYYQQQAEQHFARRQQVFAGLNIAYVRLSTVVDAIEDRIPWS
jgi:uncharacterized protein (DUF58 family)